ncbi:type VI secretion system-associated FHA domain protein TagH [Sandarakinorhabdus sp.]|uniref:type VI secretion system-associated FHA domain protein TagH n=1 Tax=Sandarakinorhabdus sp. TaxID=1916663 RepID=UPI00286D731E|nr:type VI secretion system-associated FHA domain protein TagH [Sandarakinorhabdus sp.]
MSCTLTIENVSSLASGDPCTMVLSEHGLVIGRAAHADWTLPDPRNFVSSLHAEVDFVDGQYVLTDRSTNGTFVNGGGARLAGPYVLRHGDLVTIGGYEVRVSLSGAAGAAAGGGASPFATAGGGLDWLAAAGSGASRAADTSRFGKEAPKPLFQSGADPLMANFAPPPPAAADPFGLSSAPTVAPAPDPFGLSPPPARPPASPSPAADPFGLSGPAPAASSFGAPQSSPPAADPFGLGGGSAAAPGAPFATPPAAPAPAATAADNPWAKLHAFDAIDFATAATTAAAPPPAMPPPAANASAPTAAPSVSGDGGEAYAQFLAAAGLKPKDVGDVSAAAVLESAGRLLRQTADGLIRLLDARARIRHQFGVGAQVTSFQAKGNNPLKWTRSPEQAVRQLVGEPDAGFLTGPQAVQGAFEDLQAHEVAMLAAMQEALAATVQRFAPDSIRARAQAKGGLLPGAKEAALWRAFETEFRAMAAESEAAYLDLFARQFRAAYERNIKKG